MNAQILISIGQKWASFSMSKTAQLDYCGFLNDEAPNLDEYQKLNSDSYFTASDYTYIDKALNLIPTVYVAPTVDISEHEALSFLLHVGALIAAVEAGDSQLAGDLYLRRQKTFNRFAAITSYILSDIAPEIVLSLVYGEMPNVSFDEIPLIVKAVEKKLALNPAHESFEQALFRYIQEHTISVTVELVGTCYYRWDPAPRILNRLSNNLSAARLLQDGDEIRKAIRDLYAGLEVSVQAEPYNHVDKYAIAVSIENIEAKICGNRGLEKAGYIRATLAKLLRTAKPAKIRYKASLLRLANDCIAVRIEL